MRKLGRSLSAAVAIAVAMAIALVSTAPRAIRPAAAGTAARAAHWSVNWPEGTVSAWGEWKIVPDIPVSSPEGQEALVAAEKDALAALDEAVRALSLTADRTVGDALASDSTARSRVEALVRAAPLTGATHSLADTAMRATVMLPLAGALFDAVAPESGFSRTAPRDVSPPDSSRTAPTGLIVDAGGLGAAPALLPRILDAKGRELFAPGMLNRDFVIEQGAVAYAADVAAARAGSRAGTRPLLVKATRVRGHLRADLVLSDRDARRVREAARRFDFLRECRVVIVLH